MRSAEQHHKQAYHHGNVKVALVHAAISLLQEEPVQNLSLRRLAKEVGITPTAVYNHFSDKDALIAAIKQEGFDNFNAFLQKHCAEVDDPEKIMLQLGIAYYRFSREFSSQFDILFNYSIPFESNTEELIATACQSQDLLKDVIQAILVKRGNSFNEDILIKASIMAWTQIHGLVTLAASGSIGASAHCHGWPEQFALLNEGDVERMIADQISVLIQGMTSCQCFQVDRQSSQGD